MEDFLKKLPAILGDAIKAPIPARNRLSRGLTPDHCPRRQASQAAFSLVEVLAVVAVAVILAALFSSAAARAKQRAQRLQCAANLRQLGIGLQVILANDHAYPLFLENTNGSWINQLAIDGLGDSRPLTNFIRGGPWHCPSAVWLKYDTNYLPICYGYNIGGVVSDENADNNFGLGGTPSTRMPIKESQVIDPADMIALGDVFRQRIALTRDPLYGSVRATVQRHQGTANIVFCDGHVESPRLKPLFVQTNDAALARWNRDHQPHRERLAP